MNYYKCLANCKKCKMYMTFTGRSEDNQINDWEDVTPNHIGNFFKTHEAKCNDGKIFVQWHKMIEVPDR